MAGAFIDPQDVHGNTPLWRAVFNFREAPETIIALVSGGADVNVPNHSGITPRVLAETIANYGAKAVLDAAAR